MLYLINLVSTWAIPVILAFIPLYAYAKKVPVYDSFVDGAKDGFSTYHQYHSSSRRHDGGYQHFSSVRRSGLLDILGNAMDQKLGRTW